MIKLYPFGTFFSELAETTTSNGDDSLLKENN